MKKIKYIFPLILIGLFSCKKNTDNLSPAPTVAVTSYQVAISDQSPFLSALEYQVVEDGAVRISYDVVAKAKIEQIDFKATGSSVVMLTKDLSPVELDNVPFDWVGLQTARNAFIDKESGSFVLELALVSEETYVTVVVVDKNKFRTSSTIKIEPLVMNELAVVENVTVYTSLATVNDVDGTNPPAYYFNTEKMRFNAFSDTSALADIAFVTVEGNAYLKSALLVAEDEYVDAVNKLETVFAVVDATIQEVSIQNAITGLVGAETAIQLEAGKTYLYKNSKGQFGAIKVNAISNGSDSGNINVEINFDLKKF